MTRTQSGPSRKNWASSVIVNLRLECPEPGLDSTRIVVWTGKPGQWGGPGGQARLRLPVTARGRCRRLGIVPDPERNLAVCKDPYSLPPYCQLFFPCLVRCVLNIGRNRPLLNVPQYGYEYNRTQEWPNDAGSQEEDS